MVGGGRQGSSGLDQAISQLEGWAAPVAAWEQSLLGARCANYSPAELDQRFLSGELAWFRPLVNDDSTHQVVAASPVAIVPRAAIAAWQSRSGNPAQIEHGNRNAERIYTELKNHGAMFTPDLERATGLLRPQLEDGLKMLVYTGAVTADAFSPLRWLLRPERFKARAEKRARGDGGALPLGRWSILADPEAIAGDSGSFTRQKHLAAICQALLRRYGVVFRAVLQKETLLPPWRELLKYFRRMEDRGEVRGGRFVDGFSGEQFALPEALGLLKQCREAAGNPSLKVISATDPLNLGGVMVPGPKTPSHLNNRILLEDGLPVARQLGDEYEELKGISATSRRFAREALQVIKPWKRSRSV